MKYTYYGDDNLDGVVTTGDFSLLLDGLATGGSVWSQGDYTYDGKVDLGNDVNLFLAAYLHNGGARRPGGLGDRGERFSERRSQKAQLLAAVPEPMLSDCLASPAARLCFGDAGAELRNHSKRPMEPVQRAPGFFMPALRIDEAMAQGIIAA